MSEELENRQCHYCNGDLANLGVLGKLLISRCRSCGLEHKDRISEASSETFSLSNVLRECITCNAKYAAAGDPDLCPDCHASFNGRTAAKDDAVVRVSAPKYCDFCDMTGKQVRASFDGKTKMGAWGYMCEKHFEENGVGLGLGQGQRLVVEGQKRPKIKNQDLGETVEEEFPVIEKPDIAEPIEPIPQEDPVIIPDYPPVEWPAEAPVEPAPAIPVGVKHKQKEKIMANTSDNAHPNGELTDLIAQQRQDTSRWQDGENHSPNPNVDPSSLRGQSETPDVDRMSETSVESGPRAEQFVARVFTSNSNDLVGGKVLLQDGDFHVVGSVELEAEDGFLVNWRTGRKSIEKKAGYELVVVAADATRCPAHQTEAVESCPACEAIAEEKRQTVPDEQFEETERSYDPPPIRTDGVHQPRVEDYWL